MSKDSRISQYNPRCRLTALRPYAVPNKLMLSRLPNPFYRLPRKAKTHIPIRTR